ncbi:MAG: acylphosphatase [Deltaproteobacteria bacterium]|nr:MAG: acylphosphatase [Deltaproteobacteria bacterium]
MEPRRERWTLRARGRVQGVFFRAHTEAAARRLGLVGWVRNEPDGSVTAVAEGPIDALEALAEAMRQGPPAAEVEDLEIERGPARHDLEDFRIVR